MPLSNTGLAPYPRLSDSEYHEPVFDFSRFDNSTELVKYGCSFMPDDHPTRRAGYDPVCRHPYVPKGWNLQVGGPNASEVVFGDCSQIIASTSETYNMICVVYIIIALLQMVMWLYFLKQINDVRIRPLKRFWLIPKPNINEQIMLLCLLGAFNHVVLSIDVDNAAGRLPIWLTDIFMALNFFVGTSCNAILITSWVTVIDGGKNRKAPTWARVFKYGSVIASLVFEVGCSLAERVVGRASTFGENTVAANGDVMSFKYLVNAVVMTIYGVICFRYGRKISRMLRHGKPQVDSPEGKKIKRYCKFACGGCFFNLVWRGFPATIFMGHTSIQPPPCEDYAMIQPLIFIGLVFNFICAYVIRPRHLGIKRQIRGSASVGVALSTDLSASGKSKNSKQTVASGNSSGGSGSGSGSGGGIESQTSDSSGGGQFQEVELDGKKYWLPSSNYTSTSQLSMVSSFASGASEVEVVDEGNV
ncbi:hypothetical protein ScalyP_jg7131 [Parmales sp. scaly parma]|nr:hypothetical protein ScalyP_jg7131 [Parmales sp. scaly parma]